MQLDPKELEMAKQAFSDIKSVEAHNSIIEALSISDPTKLMQLNDALAPKYKWGEFAHPIEILAALRRHLSKSYGFGWTEWDPATLIRFVNIEFGETNEWTNQKILALSLALTSDKPWTEYDVFENVCLAFNNHIPTWGVTEPMDTFEMAFGIGVLDAIRQDEYDDDVLGYMAATYLHSGVIALPDSLPVPDVNFIMQRQFPNEIKDFANECILEWDAGNRTFEDPESPLDVQLSRFFEIEESYNNGNDYIPTDKRRKDTGPNTEVSEPE